MRRKSHVRFGGRAGETDRRKRRHRAPVRPNLANTVIDDVRRRTQQATLGHRGRKPDPLRAGDPDGEVTAAWQLNQITRDLYRAPDIHAASDALTLLYTWADTSGIRELRRFAATVRRWQPEVLAYFTTGGASNGPTEAVNLTIKQIKRVGRGFTNLDNYRLRLLLRCGGVKWQDQPAARLRGRRPRSAA